MIAYLSPRRHVSVIDDSGVHHAETSSEDAGLTWGTWGYRGDEPSAHSWPTWSPSGAQLACFRISSADGQGRVLAWKVGSKLGEELTLLGTRLPVYLQWCRDDRTIAILAQEQDRLALSTVRVGEVGGERRIRAGSPMFFTWVGQRLAVFAGSEPSLALVDPLGRVPDHPLPGVPGNFCAPLYLEERILYVAKETEDGPYRLVSADLEGDLIELTGVEGLTALVAEPGGRRVALAVAPGGDPQPYQGLFVLDVLTGMRTHACRSPCTAFFWAGESLVTAATEPGTNQLRWSRLDADGSETPLLVLSPTRDLGFYLRFFEQYAQSHALVDRSGAHLLLAGTIERDDATPKVLRVPIAGGAADVVAEGVFAVYGPR